MLKNLWSSLFPPAGPPWVQPRLVTSNEPEYDALRLRLAPVDLPPDPDQKARPLDTLRDRDTHQVWDVVVVDDGPVPLYGLRPRARVTLS